MSCSGRSALFFGGTELFDRKSYTGSDLEAAGFSSNSASSLMIPYGYSVDLYDHDGFWSEPYTVNGPFFVDATQRHACISLFDDFNDRTTSLEVYKSSTLGMARGYWRSITQTESLSFTVYYGMKAKDSEYVSTTQEKALSFEMKAGVKYLGGKISGSYAETIRRDIEQTYTYNVDVEYTITCTQRFGMPGVGLWQWVTESSDG